MLFYFFHLAFLIHSMKSTINEDTAVGYVSGTIEEFIVEEPSANIQKTFQITTTKKL